MVTQFKLTSSCSYAICLLDMTLLLGSNIYNTYIIYINLILIHVEHFKPIIIDKWQQIPTFLLDHRQEGLYTYNNDVLQTVDAIKKNVSLCKSHRRKHVCLSAVHCARTWVKDMKALWDYNTYRTCLHMTLRCCSKALQWHSVHGQEPWCRNYISIATCSPIILCR